MTAGETTEHPPEHDSAAPDDPWDVYRPPRRPTTWHGPARTSSVATAVLFAAAVLSTLLSLVAGGHLGGSAIPQVLRRSRKVLEAPLEVQVTAVLLTVAAVGLSCGIAPVRDRASRVIVRLGQVVSGLVLAVSGTLTSLFWASLPFAAEGCAGGECWPSAALGWATAAPLLVTALAMVLTGALCRNAGVGRVLLPLLAAVAVSGYFLLWDPYLLHFVTGSAPAWYS